MRKIRPVWGVAFPELGWVPAPRYVLRRAIVMRYLKTRPPARILEIGPGIGALMYELAASGWRCSGVEASPAAMVLAKQALADCPGITLAEHLPEAAGQFDYVMAFEVLEHIEDDRHAVASWRDQLRSGGTLILSVPSHKKKWGRTDELAGHFRRYERAELVRVIEDAGFRVESITCYGWPLSNLIITMRTMIDTLKSRKREKTKLEYTYTSGIDRKAEMRLYRWYANRLGTWALSFGIFLQRPAGTWDWGTGYVIMAVKP